MVEFTRRRLVASSVAAAVGASVTSGGAAAQPPDDKNTPRAPHVHGELKRFSSTALGAEVTGPFVFADGSLLYSLQHPSRKNPAPYNEAGIGYFRGFRFELDGDNDDFHELPTPQTTSERGMVRGANSQFEFLAHGHDPINGGTEELGVTQTPDGTNITTANFAGTQYGDAAYNPDCNQFVPTDDDGTEGFLFTNWENSPGNISRIPISQDDDGDWTADLDNAINLVNTQPFRDIGGTRINCYGDLSPWGTMISSEENYAHPRLTYTATAGDIIAAGTGQGRRGAHEFWNRPNPASIQDAVGDYYGDDAWYVQGYWAMTGVEFLAYYLGAAQVDQGPDGNTTEPITDVYPNPYRYGYHVDIRDPEAPVPTPIKYYVMGRAAWESPDIQSDRRTVYGCSDGDSKGIYKFVADAPIDGYADPGDIEGTIFAPKVVNEAAAKDKPPADVDLEIEWWPMGSATNAEVEAWIAEYDGITQADYLASHSSWTPGDPVTDAVLEAADRTVVEDGNQDYITDQEIVDWAEQWDPANLDDVDEDLRRVPFLETRAAAKEIGATIEFNKAEGVDSVDGAGPGDYVYFAISELNDDMSNDEDYAREYPDSDALHIQRVDGGVVYRGVLEDDYNVSVLEPVIVGPDASDPAPIADDALINIDNVYVMDDGRVLCCEDADQFGRSYSNDCLYVYRPDEDADRGHGNNDEGDDADNPGRGRGPDDADE